jgi:preprotein translocase subunit SecY
MLGSDMDKRILPASAFNDLVIIAIVFIFVFILSYFFNVFAFIVDLLKNHPNWITYIDEVITGLLTLSVGFAIFAWRRWQELKKETARRIKIQEELIKIANTKAETERIISKQLRCEIEQRKQIG